MTFAEHTGVALGSVLGEILLLALGYGTIFKVTGLLFLFLAPVALYLPKTKTHIFEHAFYKREIFRKEVVFFSAIMFLYSYHWGAEKTAYALFLKENIGLSQIQIGIFIGITCGLLALIALVYGKLLDHKIASMKKLFVFGLLVSSVGHIMFALSTTKLTAYFFRIMHELGDASFILFSYVMTSNLFKKSRIGGGSGFISQLAIIGGFLRSLLSGVLLQYFGNRVPMVTAGILTLAAIYFIKGIRLKN